MNPAAYGRKLQGVSAAPRCTISRSDVDGLLTRIYCGIRQLKSHNCQTPIGQCMRESKSADVYLKESPGYYVKRKLAIKSCCTVNLTIHILLTVKWEILVCSR